MDIDRLSTLEMVRRINDEDKKVALAVERELEPIAQAVDAIYDALRSGGRPAEKVSVKIRFMSHLI